MSLFQKELKAKGLHIIICGCGKVGKTIVEHLINENHDITVIDRDPVRIQQVTDSYDVYGIIGNAASVAVLEEAGIDQADILIAVTDSDELNMLCCVVAKQTSNCEVIARVRTPEYSTEAEFLKEKLGLAMIINPDQVAARAISQILSIPTALSVVPFARGQVDMLRIKLPAESMLAGKKIMEIGRDLLRDSLICAVERKDAIIIPSGAFTIQAGDIVSFIVPVRNSKNLLKTIGCESHPVRDAIVIGGGRSGYYLGKNLIEEGISVKIIEQDPARCAALSELLSKAIVINGDGTDVELLREVGIETAEAVVSLTGMDEENILLTLHAKEVSNAKLITKINRLNFHSVIDNLDLGSVIFPKYIISEAIIAHVRAKAASMNSTIETLAELFHGQVEAVEFKVSADSKVVGIPLYELPTKANLLIACINRKGKIIIPRGADMIQADDTVIVVTSHTGIGKIDDILK